MMNETEREIVAWLRKLVDEPALGYVETYRMMLIIDAIHNGDHRQHSPATVKDN